MSCHVLSCPVLSIQNMVPYPSFHTFLSPLRKHCYSSPCPSIRLAIVARCQQPRIGATNSETFNLVRVPFSSQNPEKPARIQPYLQPDLREPWFDFWVKDIFDALAPTVGLSVGLAVGQSSIADEISVQIQKPKLDFCLSFDSEDLSP